MPNQVNEYMDQQMLKACPLPVEKCGQIKLKIVSEVGHINWLNITPSQFRAIEGILNSTTPE